VDSAAQIIVAAEITQESNDKRQLAPMLAEVELNLGSKPEPAKADTGYFSEQQVNDERVNGIHLYIATGKQKHGEQETSTVVLPGDAAAGSASALEKMKQKLKTEKGRALYKMRKAIVAQVFGQIKGARGIRAFLLRGLEKPEQNGS
jgi:hypothetical protein